MAIVTKVLGGNGDAVRFELDYDDALLRATALRCINTSGTAAGAMLSRVDGSRTVQASFAPGTTTIAIPGNAAQRLNVTLVQAGGLVKIDGVEQHFWWPES